MPGHLGRRLGNGRSLVIEVPDCFLRCFLKVSVWGGLLFPVSFLLLLHDKAKD